MIVQEAEVVFKLPIVAPEKKDRTLLSLRWKRSIPLIFEKYFFIFVTPLK